MPILRFQRWRRRWFVLQEFPADVSLAVPDDDDAAGRSFFLAYFSDERAAR